MYGAPPRQLEDGKAVIATTTELKGQYGTSTYLFTARFGNLTHSVEFKPYLLKISVRDPTGNIIKDARFDWWQANSAGEYFFTTYTLRGKFQADKNGDVEILTIAPGKYGSENQKRAGHFHFIVHDRAGKYKSLTSQLYVCRANDPTELNTDMCVHRSHSSVLIDCSLTSFHHQSECPPCEPSHQCTQFMVS